MTEATSTDQAPRSRRNILLIGGIAVVGLIAIGLIVLASEDDGSSTDAGGGSGSGSGSSSEDDGATPEQIMAGQRALQDVGCYSGEVDGLYGPATDQAIRDFQAAAGLTVDGIFGPATLTALENAVAAGQTVCTDEPGEVKTARLTTSDGVDQTLDVVTCGFVSESEFALKAQTETSDLSIDVNGEESSVVYSSADGNREGAVDTVTGVTTITVTGDLSLADDSADPATFELVADCS